MLALTVNAPYGLLVAWGLKRAETRAKRTSHRGEFAVHLGKSVHPYTEDLLEAVSNTEFPTAEERWPRGVVIALSSIVDVVPTSEIEFADVHFPRMKDGQWVFPARERHFGDFSAGRWAWVLGRPRAIGPFPARGMPGLWRWTPPWQPPRLFEVPEPVEPGPVDSYTRKLTMRRRSMLATGLHPATKVSIRSGDQTCGDCRFSERRQHGARHYWKCLVAGVTRGPRTDIRKSWPACVLFEAQSPQADSGTSAA